MKKRYYFLTAIISYLFFLIATFPASLVTEALNNRQVEIKGVSGTLWKGSAYSTTINNSIQLKNTEWSVNAWKLLTGKVSADVTTGYQDNAITAELGASFMGRLFANNLQATIAAKDVAQLANIPLAQLSGQITLNIKQTQWKQGELPLASGIINWKDAAITLAETASLGDINISLGESESQLLNAEIKNRGGDLAINGTAGLVPDADYMVNINLSPTAAASSNLKKSLALFAQRQPNGDYKFKKTGPLKQIGLM